MKIEIHYNDFDVQEGDVIEIEHLDCHDCGGSIGRIKQIRKGKTIKEVGSKYCCD